MLICLPRGGSISCTLLVHARYTCQYALPAPWRRPRKGGWGQRRGRPGSKDSVFLTGGEEHASMAPSYGCSGWLCGTSVDSKWRGTWITFTSPLGNGGTLSLQRWCRSVPECRVSHLSAAYTAEAGQAGSSSGALPAGSRFHPDVHLCDNRHVDGIP